MMSDQQREALAVLAEVWELSPEVRLGQLFAHLGFGEVHLDQDLGMLKRRVVIDPIGTASYKSAAKYRTDITAAGGIGANAPIRARPNQQSATERRVCTFCELSRADANFPPPLARPNGGHLRHQGRWQNLGKISYSHLASSPSQTPTPRPRKSAMTQCRVLLPRTTGA